ncbi:hypothetical protein Syun_005628 [Stephania yunnanensis]|uniref:DNA mismatch repair protein MLH3 n=1 Tax=Stephania yunnanensis TaxID=152371 RepID=A0AAP0Q651_9MAGN
MKSLRQLPKSVHSTLRSSVILFDLARVVEELIFNSIDAGSAKVNVTIRVDSCYIKVEDDGSGITRDSLVLLGERHATSKPHYLVGSEAAPQMFGFRGEALASLSDISLVEVMTKARGTPNAYRKIIKGCKCLYLGIDDTRRDLGTTVVVRDLFYNQPVRRRCMLSSLKKVLHSVKKCVLRIALVHPLVSFKVTDSESGADIFCTRPSPSPMGLLTSAFGVNISRSLDELSFSKGALTISGYLSGPVGVLSSKVYDINSQFVSKGQIHKFVNNLAVGSKCLDLWKDSSGFQNGKRSRVQVCPAYLLNLRCPRSSYDLTFETSKTIVEFKNWDLLLSFVEQPIRNFWRQSLIEGKHEIWEEDGDVSLSPIADLFGTDISMESKINKKKSRFQHDQTYLCLSPSSFSQEMASESSKFAYDSKNCRKASGKASVNLQVGNTPKRIGYLNETEFMTQDKHSASNFKCIQNVTSKGDDLTCSREDTPFVIENSILLPSKGYLDNYSFDQRWGNVFTETDTIRDEVSSGALPSFENFGGGNEDRSLLGPHMQLKKPLLQSCSFLGSISPVRSSLTGQHGSDVCFTNRHGTNIEKVGCCTSGRRSDDTINVLDGSGGCQHFDLSLETSIDDKPSPYAFNQKKFHADTYIDGETLLNKYVKPPSCDWMGILEENGLDSPVQIEENIANPISKYSDMCSSFSVPYEKGVCLEADASEENFMSFTTDSSYHLQDRKRVDDFIEECSVSSCANIEFDNDYAVTHIHRAPFRNRNTCVQNIGSHSKFDDGMEWSFLDSVEDDIHCHKKQAFQSPQTEESDFLNIRQNRISRNRSRRSCSAPPFYRGKHKFATIHNSLSTAIESNSVSPDLLETNSFEHATQTYGISQYNFEPCARNNLEIDDLKNSSQATVPPVDFLDPSEGNDSQFYLRTSVEKMPYRTKELNKYQKSEEFERPQASQSCQLYSSNPAEDELKDTKFSRVKWRNSELPLADVNKSNSYHEHDILDISSGVLHLAGVSLVPDSISKDCLNDSKVLLQLDKKFIPVVGGRILSVIDQHAADERIQLEELREKVLSGEGKTVAYLDAEQELVLHEFECQLLQNYAEHVKSWGWICNIHHSGSFAKNINILHRQSSVATLVAVPCILGVNLTEKDLLEFLEQLAETDGSSNMPPSVLRVLNFKSCRGAIMFGDALLPSECSLIIEELKKTSLCFQCAHGRPTTVPLVNLGSLHKQIANMGLWNACSDQTWHGLRRHALSLDRAKQRLMSA